LISSFGVSMGNPLRQEGLLAVHKAALTSAKTRGALLDWHSKRRSN
jgi:hypothetical protein